MDKRVDKGSITIANQSCKSFIKQLNKAEASGHKLEMISSKLTGKVGFD